jgi:hypothetical protein
LVPERITVLTTAPPTRPYSALKLLVMTLNSATLSGDGIDLVQALLLVPRVVVDAVEQEVVIGAPHPVGVEGALTRSGRLRRDRRPVDVRRQQGEVGVVAPVERQLDDLVGVDHLAMLARIGLERGGRSDHLDRFRHRAHLQRDVDALSGVDVHDDIGGAGLCESGLLDRHGVAPDADVEELIVAVRQWWFSPGCWCPDW